MAAPLPVAYLNGRHAPLAELHISPLDRGFLFGDGVYEVIPAYAGRLFHLDAHLRRLQYSLDGIRLHNPHAAPEWSVLLADLVRKNGGGDQALYLQITRGADAGRDHAFPQHVTPTVFAMCAPLLPVPAALLTAGARAVTLEDIRWQRCDIKCVALLGNVLLKQAALDQEANEAVLLRDGLATEGTASSLFIVQQGEIRTPPASARLLPSITRNVIVDLAHQHHLPCREADIPAEQLPHADEIWFASSTREVYPVTELNGRKIGNGRPGPVWRRLYELFQQHKQTPAAG